MQLEKYQIEPLVAVLKGTEGVLNLAESRIRDSFLKKLTPELETYSSERNTIYIKFCNKNEEGKPDLTDNNFHFAKELVPEVNKELEILVHESVTVEEPKELKEYIERSDYKPKTGEVEIIDEIISKL